MVVVYSDPLCGFCTRAKQLLRDKGVRFEEIDLREQPERRPEMIARSGRYTVPQIFIGATHVGGCTDLQALDADGKLDTLLGEIVQS